MALKWLPYHEDWDKNLKANNLKDDGGVSKELKVFWAFRTDEFDKRLGQLPKLQKVASNFKKSKEVKAAGKDAEKIVDELLEVIPKVKKEVEQNKKDFQCNGAHPIDVQFVIVDWNGKSFEHAEGFASFESPGVPKVTAMNKLTASGLNLNDIRLRPSGTVSLMVSTGNNNIDGTTDYEFKPGKPIMKFRAEQLKKSYKTKAKTIDEVTKKFGIKGTVGVEFKVVSVGGEVTKESEYKEGYEKETEWEIEVGVPNFKDIKQI